MESKRPSGAAFRKKKKDQEAEALKMKQTFNTWLKLGAQQINSENTELNSESDNAAEAMPMPVSDSEINSDIEPFEELQAPQSQCSKHEDNTQTQHDTILSTMPNCDSEPFYDRKVPSSASIRDIMIMQDIDRNNPHSWLPITDEVRCALVENGPEQGIDCDFQMSASSDGRHFSKDWFYKQLPNGEAVTRKWLIYSSVKGACFCFPCILFANERNSQTSRLASAKQGVSDWKHLSDIIPQHESNAIHRRCCVEWKQLELGLKAGTAIDSEFQKAIANEKEKWRCVLRVIVDAIMFCAKNNLALRGTTEQIGESNCGIFLSTIELISHYNRQIFDHMQCIKQGSTPHKVTYFSPDIQNEVIEILRKKVKSEILTRICQAKYFSMMFDSTPDVSHSEQVAEIIRYVHITGGKCSIEESFIDFIETQEKTGLGLANEIINKLDQDGLLLADCRGQSYDNGANMAGVYKGVQAQILQRNTNARFVPCAAHTLNLVGVHAAAISATMISAFGTIQAIYNFFSSSTARWQKLMSVVKISLKSHSDTRWTSRAAAVNALCQQLTSIYALLETLSAQREANAETVSGAARLLTCINFKFICLLQLWSKILTLIDRVSQSLQRKNLSVLDASKMIKGLLVAIQNLRDNGSIDIYGSAKEQAEALGMKQQYNSHRKRKVKRLPSESAEDESSTLTDEQVFHMESNTVFDKILCDLKWRFEKMSSVASDFDFLNGEFLQLSSVETLKKHAADLALKYPTDIDAAEITSEIESFKFQSAELLKDQSNATPMDLLQFLHLYSLQEVYPNIEIALRIFLTLPVTVASCERSFSKLKIIKNYLRSTMGQERLSGLAVISIERDISTTVNYDDVIDQFAACKARRVNLV